MKDNSDTQYSESEFEEGESRRFIHAGKRRMYIPNPYIQIPHTRPENKLRLTRNLIPNPNIKDEIINVDDSP